MVAAYYFEGHLLGPQVLMVLFDIMASHWAMMTWHDARLAESAAALAQLQQVRPRECSCHSCPCKPCINCGCTTRASAQLICAC